MFGGPAVLIEKKTGEINVGGIKLTPIKTNRGREPSFQFDSSEEEK
jgi:hypothetical protein